MLEMFYNDGMITKNMVKQRLIRKLNWIKNYTERYEKKLEKRNKKFEKIISKCVKRKSREWCEQRYGNIFNRVDCKLDQIYKKIVKKQYQSILRLLKHYNQKRWIDASAYAIIKEDIEYLISSL